MERPNYRIMYYEHPYEDGHFISVNEYTPENSTARYEVHLDTNEMIFYIKRMSDVRVVYRSDKYTNLNAMKRAARNTLSKKYGVKFLTEDRDRTFGRCDKGYTQEEHVKRHSPS